MRALIGLALPILLPLSLSAQLISLKTVPIAAGDQFRMFPAARAGLAADIAVEDSLLDPFVNPATGARLEETRLFGSPSFYDVTGRNGGGKTLPVGSLMAGERWFGAVAFALQELEAPERGVVFGPWPVDVFPGPRPDLLSERSGRNMYAYGAVGRRVGESTAIGASVFWAGLEAVEGVTLLYPLLSDIDQDGSALGLRLGLMREWGEERRLEAVALYSRWDVTHDVRSFDWVFEPLRQRPDLFIREERNRDRTDTWGLHLNYTQPLGSEGWRIGGVVTGNYKTHPKIPNYEIQNIPRDPGHSWAGNFGVGVSRTAGPAAFAVDVIYEPIRSDTWQEADARVTTASGKVIDPGGRTIDNDFTFSNATMRLGAGWHATRWEAEAGLALRSISYDLEQTDRVRETSRSQEESWLEWSPTWAGAVRFADIELRYAGQLTSGTGLPGIAFAGRAADAAAEADFILAPAGPLTLQEASVFSHQVSVVVPIG